jgi:P pilus assembly chaperone PapD
MFYKYSLLFIVIAFTFAKTVSANLLISPTRISFDERQRTAKVTVINNGNKPQTYRVLWSEKQSLATGGYISLENPTSSSLSTMARLSPKQMHLAPGEKQTVKIAIRKPKGLAAGEYRSHLLFQALPNESPEVNSSIKINMIMSYSIPVLLREKNKQPDVVIKKASLIRNKNNNRQQFLLNIERHGDFSSYGKLTAYLKNEESNTLEQIAEIGNLSLYPEVNDAHVVLSLFSNKSITKPGNVIFKYIGSDEFKGVEFDHYTLPVTAAAINALAVNEKK